MKRIVLLFLCVVLMGSMVACKNDPEETVTPNNDPKTVANTGTSDSDLLDLGICKFAGFTIGKPKSWYSRGDDHGNFYNNSIEESYNEYFFVSGYLNEYGDVDLCDNLKDTIAACEKNLKRGIESFTQKYYSSSMNQIVDSQTEVEVNGYKMLKVKGKIENDPKAPQTHYFVGYYVLFENPRFNDGKPYPIYWLGFTESQNNLPTMEKYVDAAAKTLEKTEL